MDPEDYMTVAEAAKALKITRQGVYHKLSTGNLPGVKAFGRMLVPRSSIDAALGVKQQEDDIGSKLGELLGGM